MKFVVAVLFVALATTASGARGATWQPSRGHKQLQIWPGTVPDARRHPGSETVRSEMKDLVGGRP
jgi:hypothetical protein